MSIRYLWPMVDYLVVGFGLAGVSFCETLAQQGKTFMVVSDASQTASQVAAGTYNPVILKRFTMAWDAVEQLRYALPFYKGLETKLGVHLNYKMPVYRRFASIEEQNMWFGAADREGLRAFLSLDLKTNTNTAIDAPFGYGEVLKTGRIDCPVLLEAYRRHLIEKNVFSFQSFDFDAFTIRNGHVSYKGVHARNVVFCEGYGLHKNPYFNYLPLTGTKGEYLTVKAPLLKMEHAVKASIFCMPLPTADHYLVGATYKWKDKTNTPTAAVRWELQEKLEHFLKCDYEVVDHTAGIRPTVVDRRPLVGKHPVYGQLHVLNGFGSRGVLVGPTAAKILLRHIEADETIPQEMDIQRFTKKYYPDLL